jgi:transcriptional regulator with XRE-family HTH domain
MAQPWPDQSNTRWSTDPLFPSLVDVPRIDQAERAYAINLGALIARERLEQDVSQEELAEAAGVSITTMGRWERGINAPRSYQLARIANRLTTPAARFFDPPDSMSDLDRQIVEAVEEGRRLAYRPRRRATKRGGGGPSERPSRPPKSGP